MSIDASGNPEALRANKEASQRQTRHELELALARLRNGNPKRVKKGVLISAASVAEEANVSRSTLYRFNDSILAEIRQLNEVTPKKKLQTKCGELAEIQSKAKEYREALIEARDEMTDWARQNYALAHRVQELEEQLRQREKTIADLQARLQEAGKVVALRTLVSAKVD